MTTLLVPLRDFAIDRGDEFDPTDERAIMALESASDAVRTYTGRTFDLTTEDITLDGSGRNALLLPNWPVVSIDEIVTHDAWGDSEETLDPTAYVLGTAGIVYLRDPTMGWPLGRQNISVTYTHGFDLGAIGALPADLRAAVLNIAARIYATGTPTVAGSVEEEQIGTYRVRFATTDGGSVGVTSDELGTLERYRDPKVA